MLSGWKYIDEEERTEIHDVVPADCAILYDDIYTSCILAPLSVGCHDVKVPHAQSETAFH